MTLDDAAALLECSGRTVRRYDDGESEPSRLVLRTMKAAANSRLEAAAPVEQPPFRFIDLFAGIGGLRMGFESIGGRCVFTSEWDAKCQVAEIG